MTRGDFRRTVNILNRLRWWLATTLFYGVQNKIKYNAKAVRRVQSQLSSKFVENNVCNRICRYLRRLPTSYKYAIIDRKLDLVVASATAERESWVRFLEIKVEKKNPFFPLGIS